MTDEGGIFGYFVFRAIDTKAILLRLVVGQSIRFWWVPRLVDTTTLVVFLVIVVVRPGWGGMTG